MDYISVARAGEKWGITVKRVQVLCRDKRIPGVERIGRDWLIPKDSEKPSDARIKSGKYIGFARNKKTIKFDETIMLNNTTDI